MSQNQQLPGAFDQSELTRLFSTLQSPGIDTGNSWLNMGLGYFAQQGIFPRPQGNASIYDMMQLRSRNLDYHHIMGRAFASSQLMQRMGGINPNSPVFQAISPFLAQPDSMAWKMMAPLIGGNPVKAQMGLYADLSGQSMSTADSMGIVTAGQTDQMMDQLQGRYYQKPNIGRYYNSIQESLKSNLNDPAAFARLSSGPGSWDRNTLRSLESAGVTGVNGDFQNILKRVASGNAALDSRTDLTETQRGDAKHELRRKSLAEADSLAAGIDNPETRSKVSKAVRDVLANPDNFKGFASEFSTAKDDAYRQVSRGVDMNEGKIPGGIDYRYTRGFAHEDITGAFGAAGRLSLLGRNTGLDVAGFGGAANGALDAARGLFGSNLSGRELTSEISKLVGTGYVNMGNDTDARKLEDLLRNVKGMARVAGVQISSMVGIIDEAKNLASVHGNIRGGISGFTASNIAVETMGNSSAAMSYMDPKFIRSMGGLPAFTSAQVAGQIEAIGSPVTQRVGALYTHFKNKYGENSPLLQKIRDQAKKGDNTPVGDTAFMNSLATESGESVYNLNSYAVSNPYASKEGLEASPDLKEAGLRGQGQAFLLDMDMRLGSKVGFSQKLFHLAKERGEVNKSDDKIFAGFRESFGDLTASQESHITGVLRKAREKANRGEGTMSIQEMASVTGIQMTDRMNHFIGVAGDVTIDRLTSPTLKNEQDRRVEAAHKSGMVERRMAEKYPELMAPIIQRFAQVGLNGDLGLGGADAVARILGGGPEVTALKAADAAAKKARALYTAGSKDGVLIETAAPATLKAMISLFAPGADVEGLTTALGKVSASDLRKLGKGDAASAQTMAKNLVHSSGVSLSPEALLAASKTFNTIDPDGAYEGNGDPRSLISSLMEEADSRYADSKGRKEMASNYKKAKALLRQPNEEAAGKALSEQFPEVDIDSIQRYMSRINANVFEAIGNADTPEDMQKRASAALGTDANLNDVQALIEASKRLKILDPKSTISNSKGSDKFTLTDLATAAGSTFSDKAIENLNTVRTHGLGIRNWNDVISSSSTPVGYKGALEEIRLKFLDGSGDMSAAGEAMKDSDKSAKIKGILRTRAEKLTADPEEWIKRFDTDVKDTQKQASDSTISSGPELGTPAALGGIQAAIQGLTDIIRSVSN